MALSAGFCQSEHEVARDMTGLVHVMGSKPGTPVYSVTRYPCSLVHGHEGDHGHTRGSFVIVRWPS